MQLINRTRFPGAVFVDVDRNGTETLVLVMKATFEFGGEEEPRVAPAQNEIVFSDVHAGEPGVSSLLYESDANWGRQAADIALMAHAYPRRDGERETDVMFRVGGAVKSARVYGDRTWTGSPAAPRISAPKPFARIPLIYERAFGGTDDSPDDPKDVESEPFNPVGAGLRAKKSRRAIESVSLPNVEDPRNPVTSIDDRPAPVGFTFVAKGWKPRSDYAGTYDTAWQSTRMPLLPSDFNPKFFTAASAGLSSPFFVGGEPVELVNLTRTRQERFVVPTLTITGAFHLDAAPTSFSVQLDTLIVDAVNSQIVLVWHGSHPIHGLVDGIRYVLAEEDELR